MTENDAPVETETPMPAIETNAIMEVLETITGADIVLSDTEAIDKAAAGLRDVLFGVVEGSFRVLEARHNLFKKEVQTARRSIRKLEKISTDPAFTKAFRKQTKDELKKAEKLIGSAPEAWTDMKAIARAAKALLRPE